MINYKIDKKNKVVKATFKEDIWDAIHYFFIEKRNLKISTRTITKFVSNKKFVGKARCVSKDEFDVEKGKMIARDKLIEKFNKTIFQIAEYETNRLKKQSERLEEIADKYWDGFDGEFGYWL